jgi:hypothetical protein
MALFARIDLSENSVVGDLGPLPNNLRGLAQSTLDDLSSLSSSVPAYDGMGFWPVVDQAKPTETSRKRVGDTPSLSIDTDDKVVTRSWSLVDRDLADRKAAMRVEATAKRWSVEVGGITVAGVSIATDAGTQSKLSSALQLVQDDDQIIIDWKSTDGSWVQLDAATVTAIARAVGLHVQACFTRERAIHTAINDAADHDDLDDINISTGWPT